MRPFVCHTVADFKKWKENKIKYLSQQNKSAKINVGFVPTMGALHYGHAKLLQVARNENAITVLSIFVNPTQFNDKKDLEKYPKTWESDLILAEENGVDCVFAPEVSEIYPDNYQFQIQENEFSNQLCGAHRPGHFNGVLTVVMKLFQIIGPNLVYFGEKDFQQMLLIKKMISAFFLPIELVPVQTVREQDGLAMSSRNSRLSHEERLKAALIYKTMKQFKTTEDVKSNLTKNGFNIDYVVDLPFEKTKRRFVAAHLGPVRLIDNVEI